MIIEPSSNYDEEQQQQYSIPVKMCDIKDFPEAEKQFLQQKNKNVMACVGGPAAASLIPSIKSKLDEIIYINKDYQESNSNHSAYQSIARHGAPLYDSISYTAHALFPQVLMKNIFKTNLLQATDSQHLNINFDLKKLLFSPKLNYLCIINEVLWFKEFYRSIFNKKHQQNVFLKFKAMYSQEIMKLCEDLNEQNLSGRDFKKNTVTYNMQVIFDPVQDTTAQQENQMYLQADINSRELNADELTFLFGSNYKQYILKAYQYFHDSYIKCFIHSLNKQIAEKNNVKWLENTIVTNVFLSFDGNKIHVAGLKINNQDYIYCNKLHLTGGYKILYQFDQDKAASRFKNKHSFLSKIRSFLNKIYDKYNIYGPINEYLTITTGVSINAIFKKSERLRNIINQNGYFQDIASNGCHWTTIVSDEDYIIMRITSGGNIASEAYKASFFLCAISNTRRMFGDDLIGIISTYGCPRSVNAQNQAQFTSFAESGFISYGKGGIGNTMRFIEGAFGLMMNGFQEETVNFLNKEYRKNDRFQGINLGTKVQEIFEKLKNHKLIDDSKENTYLRMGYKNFNSKSLKTIIGSTFLVSFLFMGIFSFQKQQQYP